MSRLLYEGKGEGGPGLRGEGLKRMAELEYKKRKEMRRLVQCYLITDDVTS